MTLRLLPVGVFVCLFRETLEADPLYSDLWLEGEITDLSRSGAGHTYFSLRDEDGALKCVLFRNQALRQHRMPRIGDQVSVHGGLSLYQRSGAMQLVVDLVRPAGMGPASLELEYLRQRLEAEGLFDLQRKRPLPTWPRTIGVVTSAHGAAWQDIQHVIGRRYPLATLVLCPATVQGFGAPESIVDAFAAIQNDPRIEVVILARGGGASDDLAAFNDENVVRAVFACRVPVVTGVGHATDRTIVEEVADAAAPTPSAAAEICVPSVAELASRVDELTLRLTRSYASRRDAAHLAARAAADRLSEASPRRSVAVGRTTVDHACASLGQTLDAVLSQSRQIVASSSSLLASLDPVAVLRRGYASVYDPDEARAVFSIAQSGAGRRVVVVLADGTLQAVVASTTSRSHDTGGAA